MDYVLLNAITTDHLSLPDLSEKNIAVDVLRLDRVHPVISGNKWFKLRYYLDDAIRAGKKTILTFGGTWSNHIIATAAICRSYDLDSIGIIRGEEPASWSDTLLQSRSLGMKLFFISREDYKEKKIPKNIFLDKCYVINEGGYGMLGAEGAATILEHIEDTRYTHICCACGTGTMAAGLSIGSHPMTKTIGISVLKNNTALEGDIRALSPSKNLNISIIHDYHFDGYAKHSPALLKFMNEFYKDTSIPSDFVYTGKLFFAIHDLIDQNYFERESKVLVIHSGGLQGNNSLEKGTLIF